MNDKLYNNWHSMSDKSLMETIGFFVRHHRLKKNLSQGTVANEANISRSTLSLLERGETVTVATLIQVLRMLDLLFVMDAFQVQKQVSPIALAKQRKEERERARGNKKDGTEKSEW
ncbi:transcriptional regulator [Flagellimonas aquimarina]|uniref:Transcriptional regulator n=1 Tax=Flagellimonas aquimarina TaxID=2201895 RepID=A0A316L4H6_9FLAO|nr:helix-turn-helix transcriptional regulator [Allomuricauda koreensis]PWL39173.1 transcriptional regulator [Allomuricauda koreensis]